MPLGLVTDTDFEDELRNLRKEKVQVETEPLPKTEVVIEPSTEEQQRIEAKLIEILGPPNMGSTKPPEHRGRKNGDVNVPTSLRKIIGETAVIDGRQAALSLAADFGISPSSASAYAKGATSTDSYNKPKTDIIQHINKSRKRAISRATRTLNQALGSITQEKLDYADARDLSSIAKDMSTVIKNLEPPADKSIDGPTSNQPQFVIYAPTFKKEENFEVIHLSE